MTTARAKATESHRRRIESPPARAGVIRLATRAKQHPSRTPLPRVLVNMAMSADGKIATANRAVSSFGSRRDTHHLFALRSTVDAVMAGAGTVRAENADLGSGSERYQRARVRHGLAASNLRIVVSGGGSIEPTARVFADRRAPVLVLTTERAGRRRLDRLAEVATQVLVCGEREIDFRTVLRHLHARWSVTRLLCEGGAKLNAALFAANLVDELHVTICPLLFGGRSAPSLADGEGVDRLADAGRWRLRSKRRIGDEMFCVFEPIRS